jgi:hypothetical protein
LLYQLQFLLFLLLLLLLQGLFFRSPLQLQYKFAVLSCITFLYLLWKKIPSSSAKFVQCCCAFVIPLVTMFHKFGSSVKCQGEP